MRKLFCLFGLFTVTLTAKEPIRTWTNTDGQTIEARFIDENKDTVRIRRTDGRVFNIPLDNLSEEDQKYVESLAVDKPSPSTNTKYEIEDTDSKPTGNDVGEYGSKPNYFVKSALELEMIWVEPGTFMMGSPTTEAERDGNEAQHKVTLTQGFYLGKYEVTQEQYKKVMGKNPSGFKGNKLPVECVYWNDAVAFCEELNKKERIPRGWEFALPTEAQWEYACRAGTTTAYSWGYNITPQLANYKDSGLNKTVEVGSYKANPWGFFDMHGNVWEWTADWHGAYPSSSVIDPRGPSNGSNRVVRGGSWRNPGAYLRSAYRSSSNPSYRNHAIGFRVGFQQQ